MNAGALITMFFIAVAIIWGFWLIFKRDLLSQNIGKLVSYFAGVILTLLIVLWITSMFLPWWTVRLVENTRESENVQVLQQVGRDLWEEAMSSPSTVSEVTPEPTEPGGSPGTGIIPTPTPAPQTGESGAISGQSATGGSTHVVQSGETLYSISRRYGVSVDAIKVRNNLGNDNIQVGQELVIPTQ